MTEQSFEAAAAAMLAAIAAAGLAPHKALDLVDGQLVRYRVQGDKPGSTNGWAVLHAGAAPAGVFGSWRTGVSQSWRGEAPAGETPKARAARERALQAARRQRDEELQRVQASARERAAKLWSRARPASNAHTYLQRKKVHAYGLRLLRDSLVIPARDVRGVLHSLQFIDADGNKRFLTGGRLRGCYYAIGKPDGLLLLAEGYATAATLHQATGAAVACAFNAGNLLPVALAMRRKFPAMRVVVCADNDTGTPGNPGLTKATEAARAIGAAVAVPQLEEDGDT
jgi:putative DNA primase/helicase